MLFKFVNTHKITIYITPYLWKTLRHLALRYGSSIDEVIRMSILLAGSMCDCLPEEGDGK